jgi:hypothetical protein
MRDHDFQDAVVLQYGVHAAEQPRQVVQVLERMNRIDSRYAVLGYRRQDLYDVADDIDARMVYQINTDRRG